MRKTHGRRSISRAIEVMRHPIRQLGPVAMRQMGATREFSVATDTGFTFHGVLPEAITTTVWRYGHHDAQTSGMLRTLLREGDSFVDVGAHFGYFSLLADGQIGPDGRLVAVEAIPSTAAFTRRNLAQCVSAWHLAEIAAWNEHTTVMFHDPGIVSSSLSSAFTLRNRPLTRAPATSRSVAAEPLDDTLTKLGITHVDGMKIDAESAELLVLQGLSGTLRRDRPWLVIELGDPPVCPGGPDDIPSARISSLLAELGYGPYRFDPDARALRPLTLRSPVSYANVAFIAESAGRHR